MSKASELRRRLDAVAARIGGTFAGRLASLTAIDRATYEDWKARSAARHHRSEVPGSFYARLLSGEDALALSSAVRTALFGPVPVITINMTEADAADAYRRFALDD